MKAGAALTMLLVVGCGPLARLPAQPSGTARVPAPAQIEALALRADAMRLGDLGGAAPAGLDATFAGPAEELLRRDAERERLRGERIEALVAGRLVVHWSTGPGAAVAVVATSGRERLIGPAGASAWDNFADQWQYTLRWSSGWRVWDAADLPPAAWWPA